jgi:hypothetical protein
MSGCKDEKVYSERKKCSTDIDYRDILYECSLFEQDEVFLSEGKDRRLHNLNAELKLPVIKTYIAFSIQILSDTKVKA